MALNTFIINILTITIFNINNGDIIKELKNIINNLIHKKHS